jgi:myo-inositol-hexaphosphate 3-phosphohydrolase
VQSVAAPAGPTPEDARGRFNNVDLVPGVRLGRGRADLAVTTDRGNDRLRIYRVDPAAPGGPLTDVTDPAAAPVFAADQAGARYPRGLLVVQDGHDTPGDGDTAGTDFTFVDLGDVKDALDG